MLQSPVLKKDLTSDPPWLPIPQQARLTLSLAATGLGAGLAPVALWVRMVGSETAAVSAAAFFRKERLEASFCFMKVLFLMIGNFILVFTIDSKRSRKERKVTQGIGKCVYITC
jgi:hypothetical protein